MPAIPSFVLKKLYVEGSLRTEDDGFALELKNVIAPGTIAAFTGLDLDGQTIDPTQITLISQNGNARPAGEVSTQALLQFPVNAAVTVRVAGQPLEPGPHELVIHIVVQEVGPLDIPVADTVG